MITNFHFQIPEKEDIHITRNMFVLPCKGDLVFWSGGDEKEIKEVDIDTIYDVPFIVDEVGWSLDIDDIFVDIFLFRRPEKTETLIKE